MYHLLTASPRLALPDKDQILSACPQQGSRYSGAIVTQVTTSNDAFNDERSIL